MKRIFPFFLAVINAQNRWTVSSLATVDQVVDSQTDLIWTLQSSVSLQQNDCIQISIANPYQDVTSYNSFKAPFGLTPCEIDNYQGYECRTLSETSFQIKVTGTTVQQTTLLQGRTTGQVFRNPFSTRRLIDVSVSHLPKCDSSKTPLVQGQPRFPQFLPLSLLSDKITIQSSSQKVGATDATLTVTMEPSSQLQTQGRILIKSPTWYQKESTKQEGVLQDQYADWLIGFDPIVTIETLSGETVTVDRAQFDQSIQTLLVYYTAAQTIPKTQLTLKITDFKNPVTQTKATGFQVSTADSLGFLIEQSSDQLALSTPINQPRLFNDVQIQLLGDENGENIGMISTFQKVQFSFSLVQPLEPFCYFVFEFPKSLLLGQTVRNIQGTGIFQPYSNTESLNTGQYEVESVNNQLKVQGCRLPDSLSVNPFGTLTVSLVKMPDYVKTLDPIAVKVYSDQYLTNLVVNDPTSAQVNYDDMTPGLFAVEMFKPSNYYASAQRVAYSIFVRPQHEMTPESRVIIDMPDLLTFDRNEGCSVVLTISDCELHPTKNQLTLTNIFDTNLAGGNLIKFIILQATNPQGSRPTGPWSIRSETPVNGIFYVVDGQTYAESFFALSGTIQSELTVDNLQVSSSDTLYSFELRAEHDIPQGGKLILTFPVETPLKTNMTVIGLSVFNQTGSTLTFKLTEVITADTPIKFSVKDVQNVRSFQPSSKFYIATTDQNDYIIDSGGQDIIVTCTKMAYFNNVTIENLNKTNGAVNALKITLELAYPILNGDTLHLEVPEEMSFGPNVTCSPGNLVQNITCTHSDRILYVHFDRITEVIGNISVIAYGIRNPPSLKPTSPFVSVFTTDQAGFQSQQIQEDRLQQLVLQTSEPALIQRSTLTQGTEEYGIDGSVTIQFYTVNPIQPDGVIIIQWSESVTFYTNTFCQVTTFKQIQRGDVCVFEYDTRTLRIQNAFVEMTSAFNGLVQIYLSRVKNPVTNQNVQDYKLTTYSESESLFPVDYFTFKPTLKCEWSCQLCSTDKDYCTQCWIDKLPFLYQYQRQSTCLDACPGGWTSNGTYPPVCQQCDVSCETCQDAGKGGDVGRCLTCKQGFDFFQPIEGNSGLCLAECSLGFYDDGTGTCLPCNSECRSCQGSPNNCTSCTLGSNLPSLFEESCIAECPNDHLDLAGKCEACQSPCASCAVGSNLCTSCDGTNNLIYSFGVSCLSECPEGTKVNLKTNQCTGCKLGCLFCDVESPDLCFKCSGEFILFEDTCHVDCPEGSIQTFSGGNCRRLTDIDARLVYFPFLILTVLVAFVSWIGHKIKRAHLVFANFAIMLGFIEHFAIIVQVFLSFIYGTYTFAILIILIWLTYIGTLIAFNVFWRKNVTSQDSKYLTYCLHSDNQKSTQVRTFFGTFVSWKFHKLLYSRFFGLHVNQFRFSHPLVVEKLMFRTLVVNIAVTWAPLIILNLVGISILTWGTQLYMMMIENVILAILCIVVGILEHYRMLKHWKTQDMLVLKSNKINQSLQKKKLKLQVYNAGAKDHSERFNFLFLTSKVDELLYVFGGRQCKSDFYDTPDQQKDERQVYSWPMTPREDLQVDDPPRPFSDMQFDNCYAERKEAHELKQHNGEGYNKGCQKGGMFEGDLKRHEASIMTGQSDTETSEGFTSKRDQTKKRGRKNKYFRQIDQEDHNAGVNLDSDQEGGSGARQRAELDAIREEDEILKDREEQDTSVCGLLPEKKVQIAGVSLPDATLRNFNEVSILGQLDRTDKGQIITKQSEDGQYYDLKNRRVTQQGYLLDGDDDIISAQNKEVKMFQNVLNGTLPAPFSFERFNFNPYQLYGNFKGFRKETDPFSFHKITDKNGTLDSKSRQINQQGFLIKDGSIINHRGLKIFDKKQLTKDCQLLNLYNYSGLTFSIHDVMGVFKMTDTNEIIKNETRHLRGNCSYKDISGHLVNERGYLINAQGDIVNRKGKVMFMKGQLRSGEFPKIFPFSKFNMTLITGTFQTGTDGLPMLNQRVAQGGYQDDNGVKVNEHGYLTDLQGNIVDKNGNVMFEKSLLVDGRLPGLFTSSRFTKTDSDDDLSNLLQYIDGPKAGNGSSYGSEMGASPTKFDTQNQRQSVNIKVQLLKQSQSVGQKPITRRSETGSERSSRVNILKSRKKQKGPKLVKVQQMFDSDVQMAAVYGGKAEPRVRMIPKRFQTTQRERPFAESMRENSFTQLKNGTQTQLENPGPIPARPSSPSNAAFSVRDRMQIRKQQKCEASDLDQELAELYQQDVDKFIDGSNFEVESLSGFSGLSESSFMSLSHHQQEQSKTKQLETEYLSKLEQQKVQHKEQMARTSRQ